MRRSAPAKTPESVSYSGVLAGVAIGLFVFSGFALTLLLAGMVWTSPSRSWSLIALFLAFLTFTSAAARELKRWLSAWRPLGEFQTRLRQEGRNLSGLLNSAQRDRISNTSEC